MEKLMKFFCLVLLLLGNMACSVQDEPKEIVKGQYWNDESVMIVENNDVLDETVLLNHYNEYGLILVKDWQLAQKIQELIDPLVQTEFDEEDDVVMFGKSLKDVPMTSILNSNSEDMEQDIDDMIERAKKNQNS